jgi:hypothetical protein
LPSAAALQAVLVGALALGCAPVVQSIAVPGPDGAIVAAPESVSVVVVQPESKLRPVNLVDGRGQLVGQLDGRSHTLVRLTEGPNLLYAVVDNRVASVDRLEGTLIRGRLYYAYVGERADGGVELVALNARSRDGRWAQKDQYLSSTPRVQMDPERVTRAVNDLGDTNAIIDAGNARFAALDAAAQAEHAIQENDGL